MQIIQNQNQNIETLAQEYYTYTKELITICNEIQYNFVKLAVLLYKIKESKIYTVQYKTFRQYLSQPEINISLRSAERLIRIYKVFIFDMQKKYTENKISEKEYEAYMSKLVRIGISKLDIIASISAPQDREKILSEAEHLSYTDLKIRIWSKENCIEFETVKNSIQQDIYALLQEFIFSLEKDKIIIIKNNSLLLDKLKKISYFLSEMVKI